MSKVRFQLLIGKFPVVRVTDSYFVLKLAGTTEARITKPDHADIREGDLMTVYTECLLKPPQG